MSSHSVAGIPAESLVQETDTVLARALQFASWRADR